MIGYERQAAASDRGDKPLYRPREWKQEERLREKQLKKSAWFRPADSVAFFPATPGSELLGVIRKVLEEEGRRLNMSIRVVETGGISLKSELFKPELTAGDPCGKPDCLVDMVGRGAPGRGSCHHRAGALYQAVCTLCETDSVKAEYFGETGDSGYSRGLNHIAAIKNDQPKQSALAKHIREFHPNNLKDTAAYRVKVISNHRRPLQRQVTEGVKIHNSLADILINDKEEWVQPAVVRLQATQEPGGGRQGPRRGQ